MCKASTMKVAVVTYFHDNLTGFMDFSYRVAALGTIADVDLYCRYSVRQRQEFATSRFDEIVVLPRFKGLLSQLDYFMRVTRLIRKKAYDLVVMLGSQGSAFVPALPRTARIALYWNEHPSHFFGPSRLRPMRPIRKILRGLCYAGAKKADLVMPIGEAHRQDLLAHGVEAQKTQLIQMGVSDAFRPITTGGEPAVNGRVRFVYAGSVEPDRGRDIMLDAFCSAQDKGLPVHLTIVGAVEAQRQYCQDFIRQRGAENTITVLGRVSGAEVIGHLRDKDFGICIWADKEYYRFNPPTKLFEYQVAGLPVLANTIATHTHFIDNGENGVIFEYDSQSLLQALAQITRHPEKIAHLKTRSLSRSEHYLWRNIEPEFLRQIEAATAGDRP
ncbi:hypothetical protein ADU59_06880 [Pararhizobium polonicum]|uniref:Glycosyltransferase subfamily 4-like N-terminal domain-containing protein n=1 Tax=Pararhizobium polonicum TaxID=1612624 RepID=A0A1C7P4E1_9HYPH|nr:glycosyltransferase family 4 protein [Pararhizobium polonicum]OBZ96089.1 hypothetical protein ADU59_06880 [Pararhizobium polonicum]